MDDEKTELERQIAELRAALDSMVQDAQARDDERVAELAEIRETVASFQVTLDEAKRVLFGNSNGGLIEAVSRLWDTVEGLGRIFENMHLRDRQKEDQLSQRNQELAALMEHWRKDEPWKSVALLFRDILLSGDWVSRQRV